MSKVWFITGTSRGLGRAFAEAVLASGDVLAATARNPAAVDDLVHRYPDRVRAIPLDVTDSAAAKAAVDSVVGEFGKIDVVVNNAGYANIASVEQTTDEDFAAQVSTNLFGVVNVTKAVLPVLRRQHSGHIIQISTIAGRHAAAPGMAAYAAAKHGVEGFSETLALEVAPFGVKVTLIEPSGFRTDWAGSSMTITEPIADYEPSVGAIVRVLRGEADTHGDPAAGDPALAAKALLDVVKMDKPPLRLPLGNDAVDMLRAADNAKLAEIDRWEQVSRSVDRPVQAGHRA